MGQYGGYIYKTAVKYQKFNNDVKCKYLVEIPNPEQKTFINYNCIKTFYFKISSNVIAKYL